MAEHYANVDLDAIDKSKSTATYGELEMLPTIESRVNSDGYGPVPIQGDRL
jgi:hypothetical protein